MKIVAHNRPFVIGVDAHARTHALAILVCTTGEILDEGQFPATAAGLARAVGWVARRTGADLDSLWVNRGGDRRLNRALHMAVVTRMRMDPKTRIYVAKRTAQGCTTREIRRSLKRYLARQIYRKLNAANAPAAAA